MAVPVGGAFGIEHLTLVEKTEAGQVRARQLLPVRFVPLTRRGMIGYPAIAAISAAILAYEVLLVRLFAITQWHHFAFMAISIALLGFGVSGALLAVFPRGSWCAAPARSPSPRRSFAVTSASAFLLAQRLPFNPLEIVWIPGKFLYLSAIYVLLAVPFTCGGTCVGLAFMQRSDAIGVSPRNLLGSGRARSGSSGRFRCSRRPAAWLAVAALGLAAGLLTEIRREAARRMAALGGLALLGAVVWAALPPSWRELRVSEYKGFSRALTVQDARLVRGIFQPPGAALGRGEPRGSVPPRARPQPPGSGTADGTARRLRRRRRPGRPSMLSTDGPNNWLTSAIRPTRSPMR